MSQKYSCPVCGRRGLPSGCARCPQCDADLTCFQVLDVLSEPAVDKPSSKGRRLPVLAALIFLAAVLLAALALSMRSRVKELDRQLTELKAAQEAVASVKEEKPAAAESAAVPAKPEEKSAAAANNIHIEAQVKIVDDPEEEGGLAAPVQPTAETAVPQQEAGTAGEEEHAAVADNSSPPAAVVAQVQPPAVQPVSEEAKPEEQPAVLPKNLPVLRAKPKKQAVRVAQPTPAANLEEEQQEMPGAVRSQQAQPSRAVSARTFFYQTQDGETLQDIAERFYGDRRYYPVILEQNPYLPRSISSGNWMRLFADAHQAAALYMRRTEQQNGLLLWRYEVRPGETWRTIYARFFPPRYSGRVFYDKNPQIVPGGTVLIILR